MVAYPIAEKISEMNPNIIISIDITLNSLFGLNITLVLLDTL